MTPRAEPSSTSWSTTVNRVSGSGNERGKSARILGAGTSVCLQTANNTSTALRIQSRKLRSRQRKRTFAAPAWSKGPLVNGYCVGRVLMQLSVPKVSSDICQTDDLRPYDEGQLARRAMNAKMMQQIRLSSMTCSAKRRTSQPKAKCWTSRYFIYSWLGIRRMNPLKPVESVVKSNNDMLGLVDKKKGGQK